MGKEEIINCLYDLYEESRHLTFKTEMKVLEAIDIIAKGFDVYDELMNGLMNKIDFEKKN